MNCPYYTQPLQDEIIKWLNNRAFFLQRQLQKQNI